MMAVVRDELKNETLLRPLQEDEISEVVDLTSRGCGSMEGKGIGGLKEEESKSVTKHLTWPNPSSSNTDHEYCTGYSVDTWRHTV